MLFANVGVPPDWLLRDRLLLLAAALGSVAALAFLRHIPRVYCVLGCLGLEMATAADLAIGYSLAQRTESGELPSFRRAVIANIQASGVSATRSFSFALALIGLGLALAPRQTAAARIDSHGDDPHMKGDVGTKPAIFFDRDGVLIEDSHYVGSVAEVRLIPGAAEAVRRARAAGFAVVVVTNQSGVARGMFAEEVVHQVHRHIETETGIAFDRWEHCPHHTDGTVAEYAVACDCRKPKPGMLLRAAAALGIDLGNSWMIGDRASDLEAGYAAGCRSILVKTGYGPNVPITEPDAARKLAAVVPSVVEAVEVILSEREA